MRDTIRFGARSQEHVLGEPRIPKRREQLHTPNLAEAPLDLIALHDAVTVLRNDHTKPRERDGGNANEHVQVTRPVSFPPPKQRANLFRTGNPRRPRQFEPVRVQRARLLLGNRDRDLVAALAAPGVQHLAPTLGRHAGAEPMLVNPLAVARTIRRLHRAFLMCGLLLSASRGM